MTGYDYTQTKLPLGMPSKPQVFGEPDDSSFRIVTLNSGVI
jgi:hypothetical protein